MQLFFNRKVIEDMTASQHFDAKKERSADPNRKSSPKRNSHKVNLSTLDKTLHLLHTARLSYIQDSTTMNSFSSPQQSHESIRLPAVPLAPRATPANQPMHDISSSLYLPALDDDMDERPTKTPMLAPRPSPQLTMETLDIQRQYEVDDTFYAFSVYGPCPSPVLSSDSDSDDEFLEDAPMFEVFKPSPQFQLRPRPAVHF